VQKRIHVQVKIFKTRKRLLNSEESESSTPMEIARCKKDVDFLSSTWREFKLESENNEKKNTNYIFGTSGS
jgi:hypothetical protein